MAATYNSGGTLLIRADADARMGTGHVMRCLALAQAWQDAGGSVEFVSRCDAPAIAARRLIVRTPRVSAHVSKYRSSRLRPRATTASTQSSQRGSSRLYAAADGSTTVTSWPARRNARNNSLG